MLIEFSVANFLSIKERQTLRMDATGISDYPERVFNAGRHKLLRSAAIYGANASGKSNLLKAMAAMRQIVMTSAERSSTAEIEVDPFLLSTETENASSYFEIVFLLDNVGYRYGFEATKESINAEWLYMAKKNQDKPLFLRVGEEIEVFNIFKEGRGLEEKTRDNALFLAVCDQFNGVKSGQILAWFDSFNSISGLSHERLRRVTFGMLDDKKQNSMLQNFFNQMNLGFNLLALTKETFSIDKIPKEIPDDVRERLAKELKGKTVAGVVTLHTKYNADGEVSEEVDFDLDEQESSGTNKVFDLSGPVFDTLQDGNILIVDELDAKLHPLLTQAIIRLFNDPETNPKNAQLIFATHDTNLLTYGQFRRDQIWFTEKDKFGATCLYSLVEYKEEDGTRVRKDRSFETDYIQGRYGAIPYIGDFSKLFQHGTRSEN